MTKYLIIIALIVLIYLYWKSQQNNIPPLLPFDDIIERKGKEPECFVNLLGHHDWESNSDHD